MYRFHRFNLKSLPEVTSAEIFEKETLKISSTYGVKFNANGLYSEQIFGPVKDYTCQCGITYIPNDIPEDAPLNAFPKCPKCGVRYAPGKKRWETYAKIRLIYPAISPAILELIFRMNRDFERRFLKFDPTLVKDIFDFLKYELPNKVKKGVLIAKKLDAIIKQYPELLDIREILVIPPEKRPIVFTKDGMLSDKITNLYLQILRTNEAYRKNVSSGIIKPIKSLRLEFDYLADTVTDIDKDDYVSPIAAAKSDEEKRELENKTYSAVLGYSRHLFDILVHLKDIPKKEGLARSTLVAKRVDYSGTTVIVPHNISVNKVKIPYIILAKLYEPYIVHIANDPRILKRIDDYIKFQNDPELERIIDTLAGRIPVILNRQPTLHRPSFQAFQVIPTHDKTIAIPSLVEKAYNADHDGDKMAIYVPLSVESIKEYATKFSSIVNNIFPGTLQFHGTSQLGYGVYRMTLIEPNSNDIPELIFDTANEVIEYVMENVDSPEQYDIIVEFNNRITTLGRAFIEALFGEPINKPINSKDADKIITRWFYRLVDKYGNVENLVQHGKEELKHLDYFMQKAAAIDNSLNLADFAKIFELDEYKRIKEEIYKCDPVKDRDKLRLLQAEGQKIIEQHSNYTGHIDFIMKSKVKGSPSNFTQLFVALGEVKDIENRTIPYFIRRSYTEGLTPTEMLVAAYGARKGSMDRSVNTAIPGYMTRKLVYSLEDIKLDRNTDDCGTKKYLTVKLDAETIDAFLFRWIKPVEAEESADWILLTPENREQFLNKTVFVRSPIYCINKNGICKKCYGEYDKFLNSTRIGIIASQSLGERATQLTMRVFHTGAAAEDPLDLVNKKLFDIDNNDAIIKRSVTIAKVSRKVSAGTKLDKHVRVETENGETFIIPKGSTVHINLDEDVYIAEGETVFTLPAASASLTSLIEYISRLLDYPAKTAGSIQKLYNELMKAFYYTEGVKSIWIELVIAGIARDADNILVPYRLVSNQKDQYVLVGIKELSRLKPLKSMLFSDFMNSYINLLLSQRLVKPENLSDIERIAVGKVLDEWYEELHKEVNKGKDA